MTKYHCPYCNYKFVITKEEVGRSMLCSACGEPLVKTGFFSLTRCFALISVLTFITPLVLMVFALIKDQQESRNQDPISYVGLDRNPVQLSTSFNSNQNQNQNQNHSWF